MPRDPQPTYDDADRLIADLECNKALKELREEIIMDRLHPRRFNALQMAFGWGVIMVALIWWCV